MENGTFNIKEFVTQLQDLKKENDKLNHLKKRYVGHAEDIKRVCDSLSDIQKQLDMIRKEIDPVLTIRTKKDNREIKELINTLYKYLKAGNELNVEQIQIKYPELTRSASYYLFNKLKELMFVNERKKGRIKILYYHETNKVVLSSIEKTKLSL
jgi:hypothetical protein